MDDDEVVTAGGGVFTSGFMSRREYLFDLALSGFTLGCEIAMVIGGVVPYIPQYLDIKKNQNTKGFSLYVCLTLLIANSLRILFWFGKHYETPLLIQSILMNITMFALIHLCVGLNNKEQLEQRKERLFQDFDSRYFWQWTDFQSYVEFIMSFVACGSLLMFLFVDNQVFVESVGFMAVFTEALLGTPQFYRNFINKSTYGMSLQMVLMWTCGDIFKTSYFILRDTPKQFYICGTLQVLVDLAILSQVWIYRDTTSRRRKVDNAYSMK